MTHAIYLIGRTEMLYPGFQGCRKVHAKSCANCTHLPVLLSTTVKFVTRFKLFNASGRPACARSLR
jgi:hypothetical protein